MCVELGEDRRDERHQQWADGDHHVGAPAVAGLVDTQHVGIPRMLTDETAEAA
jgi:hypothetical protein